MKIAVILAVFVLLCVILYVVLFKKGAGASAAASSRQDARSMPQDAQGTGIPEGKEDLFHAGMHPGEDGIPVMYTLTTCRHCVHLKDFLVNHHVQHHLVYVDHFTGPARADMMRTLRAHNPRGSFPTFIAPGSKVVVGFREREIRDVLGLSEE